MHASAARPGRGLAGNIRRHYPPWVAQGCIGLLLIANVINLGADLGSMGDVIQMLIGGPRWPYVVGFGLICVAMQVLLEYTRYVKVLKWLTLAPVRLFWHGIDCRCSLAGSAARAARAHMAEFKRLHLARCGGAWHDDLALSVLLAGVPGSRRPARATASRKADGGAGAGARQHSSVLVWIPGSAWRSATSSRWRSC